MIASSALIITLITAGFSACPRCSGTAFLRPTIALALPLGAVIWVCCGWFFVLIGIPLTAFRLHLACILIAGILFVLRRNVLSFRDEAPWLFVATLTLMAVAFLVENLNFTSDSAFMMYMSDEIAFFHGIPEHIRHSYVLAYPAGLAFLAIPGMTREEPELLRLIPALTLSLMWLIGSQVFSLFLRVGAVTIAAFFGSVGIVLLIFASPQFYFQASYLNGHIVVGTFVAAYFVLSRVDYAILSRSLFAMGVVLFRVEGAFLAILMIIADLPKTPTSALFRKSVGPALGVAVAATVTLGFGLSSRGDEADVLTPGRAWIIVEVSWLFLVAIVLAAHLEGRFRNYAIRYREIAFIGLAVVLVALAIYHPSHVFSVISSMGKNIAITGGWGITWIVILAAMIVCASFKSGLFLTQGAFWLLGTYFLLIAILGAFNPIPYYAGFFDSGNRMFMHVAPVAILALAYCFELSENSNRK